MKRLWEGEGGGSREAGNEVAGGKGAAPRWLGSS